MAKQNNIFLASGCIRREALQEYSLGSLSDVQKMHIKTHLEECSLCREALEGLSSGISLDEQNISLQNIERGLQERMIKRELSAHRTFILSRRSQLFVAAASIAVLAAVFSVFSYLFKPKNNPPAKELASAELPKQDALSDKTNILQQQEDISETETANSEKEMEGQATENLKPGKKTADLVIPVNETVEQEEVNIMPAETNIEKTGGSEFNEMPVANAEETEDISLAENNIDYAIAEPQASQPEETETPKDNNIDYAIAEPQASWLKENKTPKVAARSKKRMLSQAPPIALKSSGSREALFINPAYKDLADYLKKNMVYPDSALKAKLQGRVILEFTIDKNGIISEPKIRESSNIIFEKEALRLIRASGTWQPATENSQPVSCQMLLPIDFILPEKNNY